MHIIGQVGSTCCYPFKFSFAQIWSAIKHFLTAINFSNHIRKKHRPELELPTSAVVDMDIGQVTAGQALPVSRLANSSATNFSVIGRHDFALGRTDLAISFTATIGFT